jgi:voltage-gated potassium channel
VLWRPRQRRSSEVARLGESSLGGSEVVRYNVVWRTLIGTQTGPSSLGAAPLVDGLVGVECSASGCSVGRMPSASRLNPIERRMARFLREPVSVRNAASVIVGATLLLVVASGVAIRILDHREYSNIWLGMWWALQTVTTVGYGDVTPKNTAGRIVGATVIMEGIAFLAIITAAITSTFVVRAQAQRDLAQAAAEDLVEDDVRSQLEDLAGRLDRVEKMLIKLTEE